MTIGLFIVTWHGHFAQQIVFPAVRSSCLCFRSFVSPDRSCYHDVSWTAWAI